MKGFEENHANVAELANGENLAYEAYLYEVSKVEAQEDGTAGARGDTM